MGEIRVRVKLTNVLDYELARAGALDPDKVRVVEADAIVDTGAVQSVLPQRVVDQLGATVRGQRTASYADGRRESVGITSPVLFDVLGRDTFEETLVLGDEVLIGQTVLEKLDLHSDCKNQRLIPNPAHPDYPVFRV